MKGPRVAVFGAGSFGLWTGVHLLRHGAEVVLSDGFGVGNENAMSAGQYRLIRTLYGQRHLYIRLVAESLKDWVDLQTAEGQHLFEQVGVWWLFPDKDPGFVLNALPICKQYGLPITSISVENASKEFPYVSFEGIGSIFCDETAGYLRAKECCQSLLNQFKNNGGRYQECNSASIGRTAGGRVKDVVRSDNSRIEADYFVFACGPWLKDLFGNLLGEMRLTRQLEYYFRPSKKLPADRTPVMIDFGDGKSLFYGLHDPRQNQFKIGDDRPHGGIDNKGKEEASRAEKTNGIELLERRFPGLGGSDLIETRVCRYDRTRTEDFVADQHPEYDNVWIVGGGSGHGFKSSPSIGRYVTRLITDKTTELIPEFGFKHLQVSVKPNPASAILRDALPQVVPVG